MLGLLRDKLDPTWHTYFHPIFRTVRDGIERIDRAVDKRKLSESQFVEFLQDLGIKRGETVMLYSSFSHVRRRVPGITPEKLIRLLQELLTPEGTLLMLTFPFLGPQAHYVDTHTLFDVCNTPSRLGILTEVFRKMPGVVRSYHPTHAVAGWGRYANELLSTHHMGPTYGTTSPFYRIRERDGLMIGLGRRFRYGFTITHVPEELNAAAREFAYEKRPRKMVIIDGDREIPYEFRVFKPGMPREYERIARIMRKEKILRYVSRAGLPCAVARAEPFLRKALRLAEENNYILRVPDTVKA